MGNRHGLIVCTSVCPATGMAEVDQALAMLTALAAERPGHLPRGTVDCNQAGDAVTGTRTDRSRHPGEA